MATYYVDNQAVGASDSNVGNSTAPFLTLGHANTVANTGDTVLVRPGTYHEQLTCKNNGVLWRAAAKGVYIYGSVVVTGTWSSTSTNAFSISYVTTTSPLVVIVDNMPFTLAASSTTTTANQFFFDSGTDTLYVDMGGTNPTSHDVEAGSLSTCISLLNVTDCLIEGFSVYASNGYGILVQGGGNHTIRSNEVLGHPSGGIRLQPQSPQLFQPTDNGAGGTLAAGTYGYQVSAIISGQETLPSFALSVTIPANHTVQLQWSKIATASSFNIYARTPGSLTLLTNVANSFGAGFPTFVDDGSFTPDGVTTPPTSSSVGMTACYLQDNEVWRVLSHGIYLYGASGHYIRGNHCHHNVFHGIALLNSSNNNTVEFNICHQNSKGNRTANGIQADNFGAGTSGSSSNVIQYNRCFRNEDSGISIYNGSANCIVRRNICYQNGDHGIDNFNSQNCHMINNLSYSNVSAGLNSEGTSTGIRMYNNISMDNGVQSPRTSGNYRVDATANADAVVDYNLSFLTVPAASQPGGSGITNCEMTWGTTTYGTLAAFKTAVPSQMVHGVAGNPQFVDLTLDDFHLLSTSPGVGLGSASAPDFLATDFFGNATATPPNAGPIE
ncbi:MAG TPA: right-handed parallel beta-helix repeat-containing protein [Candidatus Saccharimonadales bacterium]|nr:right-handed parallel beta-helix repeat-containing protein [Candidatus Saccharimonadales bacterium]